MDLKTVYSILWKLTYNTKMHAIWWYWLTKIKKNQSWTCCFRIQVPQFEIWCRALQGWCRALDGWSKHFLDWCRQILLQQYLTYAETSNIWCMAREFWCKIVICCSRYSSKHHINKSYKSIICNSKQAYKLDAWCCSVFWEG